MFGVSFGNEECKIFEAVGWEDEASYYQEEGRLIYSVLLGQRRKISTISESTIGGKVAEGI